jgi:hypothetical protein
MVSLSLTLNVEQQLLLLVLSPNFIQHGFLIWSPATK